MPQGSPLCGVGQVAGTIPPASLPDPRVLQRSLPAPKGRHLAACASRTAVKTAWNQCGTARDTFELLGQPGMHRLDQRSAALLTFPLAVLGWRGADVGLDLIECGDPQAPPIIIRRNLRRCREESPGSRFAGRSFPTVIHFEMRGFNNVCLHQAAVDQVDC